MKKILLLVLAAFAISAITAETAFAQKKKTETVVFQAAISCNNCKKKIEENLPFEKGVKDIAVDVAKKSVTVVYDPGKTDAETLRKAIEKLGYKTEIATPKKESAAPAKATGKVRLM